MSTHTFPRAYGTQPVPDAEKAHRSESMMATVDEGAKSSRH